MAKSQKRSNREVRKEKAPKAPAAPVQASVLTRGTLATTGKKK